MTELRIGGVSYRMNIEADQEARLKEVARLWDGFVSRMQASAGKGMARDQLLVLAGLTMADDLYDLKQSGNTTENVVSDDTTAEFHNRLAERLEQLCERLS